MAAATVASTIHHHAGDMLFITANLTSVADTNTWTVPGMGSVDNLIVTNKGASAAYQSASWTGNPAVVTFKMSATTSLTVTAIGRP